MEKPQKNTWASQSGYIWALIGSAVGFANILSFSAKAYFFGVHSLLGDGCTFWTESFLYTATGITDFGSFAAFMFACRAAVGLFSCCVVSRNIRAGIERFCSLFLPMLAIIITIFPIIVTF